MDIGSFTLPMDWEEPEVHVPLARSASVRVIERRALIFQSPGRPPARVEAPELLASATTFHYALDAQRGCLLLVGDEGTTVYLLNAASRQLWRLAALKRWRDPAEARYDPGGLYQLDLVATDEGVLIVYECGAVSADLDGRVHWERTHTCFSICEGVDSGVLWYRGNEWEGHDREGRWGYRLEDGKRIEIGASHAN